MTDWNNLNLESGYERSLDILDPITIDIFLLEVQCNLREINEETVTTQFEESLKNKVQSARDIFKANLKNFVKEAKKERETS